MPPPWPLMLFRNAGPGRVKEIENVCEICAYFPRLFNYSIFSRNITHIHQNNTSQQKNMIFHEIWNIFYMKFTWNYTTSNVLIYHSNLSSVYLEEREWYISGSSYVLKIFSIVDKFEYLFCNLLIIVHFCSWPSLIYEFPQI